VRGSRSGGSRQPRFAGTIPARAGEPIRAWRRPRSIRDHPRACGGAARERLIARRLQGPSPRVRGSQAATRAAGANRGTIPARAGEPCHVACSPLSGRDHPRACGGSPGRAGAAGINEGTIPARAGEPRCASPGLRIARDHPRACGGAHSC